MSLGIVAIDLDSVCLNYEFNALTLREDALEGIRDLKRWGYTVTIYSSQPPGKLTRYNEDLIEAGVDHFFTGQNGDVTSPLVPFHHINITDRCIGGFPGWDHALKYCDPH